MTEKYRTKVQQQQTERKYAKLTKMTYISFSADPIRYIGKNDIENADAIQYRLSPIYRDNFDTSTHV